MIHEFVQSVNTLRGQFQKWISGASDAYNKKTSICGVLHCLRPPAVAVAGGHFFRLSGRSSSIPKSPEILGLSYRHTQGIPVGLVAGLLYHPSR